MKNDQKMVAIHCRKHNFETNDVEAFFDHLDAHHDRRPKIIQPIKKVERFRCLTCPYESIDGEDFIRHIRAHHEVGRGIDSMVQGVEVLTPDNTWE